MAGIYPSSNDREYDLLFKTAVNWYNAGVDQGISGLTPPSLNDTAFDLKKKITYFTARLAS